MRKFNVNVNGTNYEVEIEEIGGSELSAPRQVTTPAPKPVSASASAPAPTPAPKAVEIAPGDTKITSPMPGKALTIVAKDGQSVSKGQTVIILEAMKMQNEIPSPVDGVIKSINVTEGQSLKTGDLIAVIG